MWLNNINVWNDLTEVGEGIGAELSNFEKEGRLRD